MKQNSFYRLIITAFLCAILAGTLSVNSANTAFARQSSPENFQVAGPGNGGFNYAEALQKSILFYEAQRAGTYRGRFAWRGNAAMKDGQDVGLDLTGGWFDAGDAVKFGFPFASGLTLLSWGGIEFRSSYQTAGQLDELMDNIKWATDYLLKAYRPGAAGTADDQFYAQVGEGSVDHNYWYPVEMAETIGMARKSFKVTASCPGTEVSAESAAALASASMLFRPTDAAYANQLLSAAEGLYAFADSHRGDYHLCIPDVVDMYKSWSGYNDELVWGAIWLYRAKEAASAGSGGSYMTKAQNYYNNMAHGATVNHDWDSKSAGAQVLMSQFATDSAKRTQAKNDSDAWVRYWGWKYIPDYTGSKAPYSPGGRVHVNDWGSLRHAAHMSLVAFVYADYTTDTTRQTQYRNFASSQINYILGANPRNGSYVVGFGQNYPQHVHHMTAHGPWNLDLNTPANHRHILYGALAGGPNSAADDNFNDAIDDYVENEVATEYNAGLVGALAKMYQLYGGTLLPDSAFPLPDPAHTCADEYPMEFKVNSSGTNFTEFGVYVNNRSAWPAQNGNNLKFRYFFKLDSASISNVTASLPLANGATISGPTVWDATNGIYYVTVDFTGTNIYPAHASNYKRQVNFRLTSTSTWDNNNDPSFAGWTSSYAYPTTGYKHAPNVALYAGTTKRCGNEPSGGTTPVPPSHTPTTTRTRTNTPIPNGDGSPYNGTPAIIPGTVEVENYNTGGQGVAFNDTTTANQGNAYRTTEAVDVEACTDTGCGFNVGYAVAGEWLKYTVNVQTAGTYTIDFRLASQAATGSFHLEVDGVNVTGTVAVPNTGGWQTWTTVSRTGINLTVGQHVLRLVINGNDGNFNWIRFTNASTVTNTPTSTGTTPPLPDLVVSNIQYVGSAIPCTNQPRDAITVTNNGTANAGSFVLRINSMDQTISGLAAGASTTVHVGAVTSITAIADATNLVTESDETNNSRSANLPIPTQAPTCTPSAATNTPTRTNTPTTPTATRTRTNTPLPNGDGNPYNGTPATIPGTIEVENYNTGGQGVAYNDTTAGNSGNAYRTTEAVDVEACTDTGCGFNVGWSVSGEWLKYTVNVQTAGTYTIDFRLASQSATGAFHLEVDGVNVTGNVAVPNTGGWQTWTTVSRTGINLTAGQHVLRLVINGNDGNFNWIRFTSSSAPSTPTATRTRTNTPIPPTATSGTGAPAWNPNAQAYAVGDLVTYNGTTYRCIQPHTSQSGWDPVNAPSLWQPA